MGTVRFVEGPADKTKLFGELNVFEAFLDQSGDLAVKTDPDEQNNDNNMNAIVLKQSENRLFFKWFYPSTQKVTPVDITINVR